MRSKIAHERVMTEILIKGLINLGFHFFVTFNQVVKSFLSESNEFCLTGLDGLLHFLEDIFKVAWIVGYLGSDIVVFHLGYL